MLFSKSFIFTRKDVDSDIHNLSYRLLLKAGYLIQEVNGIFHYLPLLKMVLDNIEAIIDNNMKSFGQCKIHCPILQSANRWLDSGRYDAYGKETLRVQDRNNRELFFSPTAEEGFFFVASSFIKSYRDLPKYMYQINWKFRDEISPRNGLFRCREFLMKDGYSFDIDYESSLQTYVDIFNSYVDIFNDIGISDQCVVVKADSGPIGGDINHEFVLLTDSGDCDIVYKKETFLQRVNNFSEIESISGVLGDKINNSDYTFKKGLELGHIFNYGTLYSKKMNGYFVDKTGQKKEYYGGCYGLGVSRIAAAVVDICHDEYGIVWPESIAPFKYMIIFLEAQKNNAFDLYENIFQKNCLLDDRDIEFGKKLQDADIIGIPNIIILGNNMEIKIRKTNKITQFQDIEQLKKTLSNIV